MKYKPSNHSKILTEIIFVEKNLWAKANETIKFLEGRSGRIVVSNLTLIEPPGEPSNVSFTKYHKHMGGSRLELDTRAMIG